MCCVRCMTTVRCVGHHVLCEMYDHCVVCWPSCVVIMFCVMFGVLSSVGPGVLCHV